MYIYYDMYFLCFFGVVDGKGVVIGLDFVFKVVSYDKKCMVCYMFKLVFEFEFIYQVINLFKVMFCQWFDENCKFDDFNMFIMMIIQYKMYYSWYSEYELYVVFFYQCVFFEMYVMFKKLIWIYGWGCDEGWRRIDMFYVMFMVWKEYGNKYYVYLDDVVFLVFGVEDKGVGGVDVCVGELLKGLGCCFEV